MTVAGHAVPRNIYRFGDCRIDLSTRELRRADRLVVLSPTVFDCLAYLVERHDRAVGRDELVASVWGKTEITDTLLGQTILKARRAVGDSAREQHAIRTIPRFGYAWVAPLTRDEVESEPLASPAVKPPRSVARRVVLFAIAAVVGAAGLWAVVHVVERPPTAPVAPNTVAVLPVEVEAPAEWSWVRLGLMDAIASRLRAGAQPVVPSDNVIALTRTAKQDHRPLDVRAVTGAALLVVPSAAWNPAGWTVHLEVSGGQSPIRIDARNVDVLLAGRAAADQLLTTLGKTPPANADDPGAWSDAKLLQRAEAAVLTNDLAGARRILSSATDTFKQSPEYGLSMAHLDFQAGEFQIANQRLQPLLAKAPAEDDPVLRARILTSIGHVAMRLGRPDAAMSAYVEAASLLQDRGRPNEIGQAYMGRGIAAQALGDAQQARAAYSQARIAFDIAGDALAIARIEANEGMLDAARGQYATALTSLERAAGSFERFGTLNELAMTMNVEVTARLALLELREALAASDRVWPDRGRVSNPRIRDALAVNRALALEASGRRSEAVGLLQKVNDSADPERDRAVLAAARGALARISLASGDAQAAVDLALAAITESVAADETRDRCDAWLTATRALRAVGRSREAAEQVGRFAEWARSIDQPAATLFATLARAEQIASAGSSATEHAEYERALDLASDGGVPADLVEVAVSYGRHLIAVGQLERATQVVGRIAQWSDRNLACALLQARLYAALGQRTAWEHALAAARNIAGDRKIPPDASVFAAGLTSGSP